MLVSFNLGVWRHKYRYLYGMDSIHYWFLCIQESNRACLQLSLHSRLSLKKTSTDSYQVEDVAIIDVWKFETFITGSEDARQEWRIRTIDDKAFLWVLPEHSEECKIRENNYPLGAVDMSNTLEKSTWSLVIPIPLSSWMIKCSVPCTDYIPPSLCSVISDRKAFIKSIKVGHVLTICTSSHISIVPSS